MQAQTHETPESLAAPSGADLNDPQQHSTCQACGSTAAHLMTGSAKWLICDDCQVPRRAGPDQSAKNPLSAQVAHVLHQRDMPYGFNQYDPSTWR